MLYLVNSQHVHIRAFNVYCDLKWPSIPCCELVILLAGYMGSSKVRYCRVDLNWC